MLENSLFEGWIQDTFLPSFPRLLHKDAHNGVFIVHDGGNKPGLSVPQSGEEGMM